MLVAYSIEGEKCIHFISFLWPRLLSVLVRINPLCRFEEALRNKQYCRVYIGACEFNKNFQCAFKSLVEWTTAVTVLKHEYARQIEKDGCSIIFTSMSVNTVCCCN